ncbi:MAG: GAF domain-containing protein [Actinomycetota bacterium]
MTAQREITSDLLARVAAVVADASRCSELPDALRLFVEGFAQLTRADRAAVLLEKEGRLVACYADAGSQHLLAREVPAEGSLEGTCFRAGRALISHDVSRDTRFSGVDRTPDEVSLITIPLHLEGPPIGLVTITSNEPARFHGSDLIAARLLVAAMRKLLLQALRAERESLGFYERDFPNVGVWALRDRRNAQLRRWDTQGAAVTLVRYDIRGYLTANIVHHIGAVVRSSDHVFQDDAGTFTLILPGTSAPDAERVALRVKTEIETLAEIGGDPVEVDWKVTELDQGTDRRKIA